ncbi:MAG: hypothetical protein ACFFG0_11255 [Candidatus Thorarchaeota archaeon]
MEKFKIDFRQLKVDQRGFIFKDIEKQAKVMEEIYGISPFTLYPIVEFPTKYKGNETQLKVR